MAPSPKNRACMFPSIRLKPLNQPCLMGPATVRFRNRAMTCGL